METGGWQKVNQVLGSLRVSQIEEQCENIVKLPSIFEDYPFPILIDAVFLKLGDIFRECNNNFIRFCILKVILSTTQHHSKISGHDIFLRPVLSVSHSNDAVARAITLRVLGVAAPLFPEKKNVLHCIVRGLDSHMEMERDAALFACKEYAAMSQDVCKTVVPKLEELLTSLSSTETLKIKILDVFQSMNYDLDTSEQVRCLCKKLLDDQATERITDGCLRTLTQMVVSTLSAPKEVLALLVDMAQNETRRVVRNSALSCLEKLAGVQPDLFSEDDVIKIVNLAQDSASGSEIIRKIANSPSRSLLTPDTLVMLCNKLNSAQIESAVPIYQTCARLLPTSHTQVHFNPLLVRTITSDNHTLVRRLLLSFSTQHSPDTSLLFSLLSTCSPDIFTELCYCLSRLRHVVSLQPAHVTGMLEKYGSSGNRGSYFAKLLIVIYGTGRQSEGVRALIQAELTGFVEMLAAEGRQWALYCLARVAMCHGVYEVAERIVAQIYATHPYSRNFFCALDLICRGELACGDNVTVAITHYTRALTYIKCCDNTPITHFQTHFLLLRLRLLKIFLQLIQVGNIAKMSVSDKTSDFAPTLQFIAESVSSLKSSVTQLESQMIDAKPGDNLNGILQVCDILTVICTGDAAGSITVHHADSSPISAECHRTLSLISKNPGVLSSVSFIKQTVANLLSHKFHMPVFFFVQEHSTSISVATSPPIEQGIIKIPGGCNLLLTIEAVVRGNSARIKHFLMSITCKKAKTSGGAAVKGAGEELCTVLFDKEVPVVKGYLKLELNIEVGSFADVYSIDAKAVDFSDRLWNIGYSGSFRVKCDDSLVTKSQMTKSYV